MLRANTSRDPLRAGIAGAFALSALLAAPVAAQDGGWQPNDDDSLLLELRAGGTRLGEGVRGYATPGGVCVDLGDMIQALGVPVRLDRKSRRATGWLFAEDQRFAVDREAGTVQTMNKDVRLSPGDIFDAPEGWCVDTSRLGHWWGVGLIVDKGGAALLLETPAKLPFQLAAERRARAERVTRAPLFDLASLPRAETPYLGWRPPSVDAVVDVAARRGEDGKGAVRVRYDAFFAGEAAGLSVDARLTSDDQGIPERLRMRAYRVDPDARLLGPLRATQFALGDVATLSDPLVAQSGIGRGAMVTNRPFDRSGSYDRTSFQGELPEGWDAELYRNGELIDFATGAGDGRYSFIDVPLQFGTNDFEVVLYGPQGQVRRQARSFPVGETSIPAGKSWYWASFVQAEHDLIQLSRPPPGSRLAGWRGALGLEHGIDRRTSLAAALHHQMVADRRRSYAQLALRRSLGPLLAEIGGAHALGGGTALRGQLLGAIGRTGIRAETIWVQGDFDSDLVATGLRQSHAISINQPLSLWGTALPIQADLRMRRFADGREELALNGRASFNINGLSVSTLLDWQRTSGPGVAVSDRMTAGLLGNLRLGVVRLRGEARYRLSPDPGLETAGLTGQVRLGERSDLRAQLTYLADRGQSRLGVGYVRQFERFALNAELEAGTDGSLSAGMNIAFSLGPDPRGGGLQLSANRRAASGQALATVFRDDNRDGIRQPGEPLLPGIEVTAGTAEQPLSTDEQGRSGITGLRPFQPVLIGIDASSIADPLMLPSGPGRVVVPRPGVVSELMLPVTAAGEVEGRLADPSGDAVAGAGLELVDAAGVAVARTRSEFDGFFLFDRVPYGRYALRLEAPSAKALGAKPALPATAMLDEGQPVARLGIVRIPLADRPTQVAAGP